VLIWERFKTFMAEIVMFGIEAFVVVAAREVARRFWQRLASRGAAGLLNPSEIESTITHPQENRVVHMSGGSQARLPFLDEYVD
jgi:hypothetical protein